MLPLIVTITLAELKKEILTIEEKYWAFFSSRNIQWSVSQGRTAWVYIINKHVERERNYVR
jgi:septum formation topological specificity factor MinE